MTTPPEGATARGEAEADHTDALQAVNVLRQLVAERKVSADALHAGEYRLAMAGKRLTRTVTDDRPPDAA